MKKLVILIALFLLVGLGFGYMASQDPGYVLFSWSQYTLETSFWFFSIMLVAFFFAIRTTRNAQAIVEAAFQYWCRVTIHSHE